MSVLDWSTTPASNISVGGVSIAEGMSRANVNNAQRAMMAEIAAWRDTMPVSVMDFGATGDGATDDTAAIQDALDDGRAIFFPLGTYKITATLRFGSFARIIGQAPQSSYNGSGSPTPEVVFYATIADLGDGNPIMAGPVSTQIQSVVIENVIFQSNLSVTTTSLGTTANAGVVGLDGSNIKDGLRLRNVNFRNVHTGFKAASSGGRYTDMVTFDECDFVQCYRAVSADTTAGMVFIAPHFEQCTDFIDTAGDVSFYGLRINNTEASVAANNPDNCQISAAKIGVFGGYAEGGNNVFNFSKSCILQNFHCSEMFSTSGATKFLTSPQNDNATLIVNGGRIGTNTRLINLNGRTLNTIHVRVSGLDGGTNFSDVATLATQVAAGVDYQGWGNLNSDTWNTGTGFRSQNTQNSTYTFARSDDRRFVNHTSASTPTWTIPSNTTTPFPVGTELHLITSNGAGSVTVAIDTDTLRFGSSTGSRTLAADGFAIIKKVGTTEWRVIGSGNLT